MVLCIAVGVALLLSCCANSQPAEGSSCLDKQAGFKEASSASCQLYLECQNGKYVAKKCGWWHQFDIAVRQCRWSPLATCHKEESAASVQSNLTTALIQQGERVFCNYTSESCHHSVPVIAHCDWYCYCFPNGSYSNPLPCPAGKYYSPPWYTCIDDRSDCPKVPMDPTIGSKCLNARDTLGRSENCKDYYECAMNKTWTLHHCAWGQYYSPDAAQCATNWFYMHCGA